MTTKTPFELRTDILQMAKEYLENQFQNNLANYQIWLDTMTKIGKVTFEELQKYAPKYPTSEEILAQAAKFYDFVGKTK